MAADQWGNRASEIAQGVPLILYNPPHAKRVLTPKELSTILTATLNVTGVKLADGDANWYAQARKHLHGVALFVPGHHLATGVREGVAAGAFSNVACLTPRGAQRWTELMHEDIEAALESSGVSANSWMSISCRSGKIPAIRMQLWINCSARSAIGALSERACVFHIIG